MTVRFSDCTCDIFTPTGGSWTGYESACCAPDCPDHGISARRRRRAVTRGRGLTRGAAARNTGRGRAEDGWVIITPTGKAGNQATPPRRRPATLYEVK
jgi:hypothetical protein